MTISPVPRTASSHLAVKLRQQTGAPELDGSAGIPYTDGRLTFRYYCQRNFPAAFAVFGHTGPLRLAALRFTARFVAMPPNETFANGHTCSG